MQDIHDIRPPIPVGFDPMLLKTALMVLGGICVLILLFFLLKKWLKKRQRPENLKYLPPPLPPYETALTALDILSQKEIKDPRLLYFDVTAILKKYIGQTYHINALEMTSQEFIKSILSLAFDKKIKKDISVFCETSDPIKYAGIVPDKYRAEEIVFLIREKIIQIEKESIKLSAKKEEDL